MTIGSIDEHAPEVDPDAPRTQPCPAPWWAGPLAGLVAAGTSIGLGHLVAGVIDVDSPLDAVGSEFIDRTPSWLKDLAIDWFGTADKTALRVGMILTIALLAAAVGSSARRRPWLGPAAMIAVGVGGALVASGRPGAGSAAAVPAVVAALVGALSITRLERHVRSADPPLRRPQVSSAPTGWDRRLFVRETGAMATVAALAALAGGGLERRRTEVLQESAPDTLPRVVDPPASLAPSSPEFGSAVGSIPSSATLSPISPYLTPNDDFYLIDTALSVPRIDAATWSVEIAGLVDRPRSYRYDDLLRLPQTERIITLSCVSNEVGGNLVGNAVWQGVLLADLLREAGIRDGAEQVFSTSVDGWTCGFPLAAALDGRDAMIALGMNGEALPLRHGFPARLVVPGLYGYVSATKWLQRIELTTWDAAEGYWVPRGWAREAPIKTQSRIDVPRKGETVPAGMVVIAGVAWAPGRGISRVEVRVDEGPWTEAALGDDLTGDAWRQWRVEWEPTGSGEHRVQVRATDGDGVTQTDEVSRPDPDGATGWHTRRFEVEA
ncbi:MAG: hypothetical protein RI958_905 [Actinomycetota bacterium]